MTLFAPGILQFMVSGRHVTGTALWLYALWPSFVTICGERKGRAATLCAPAARELPFQAFSGPVAPLRRVYDHNTAPKLAGRRVLCQFIAAHARRCVSVERCTQVRNFACLKCLYIVLTPHPVSSSETESSAGGTMITGRSSLHRCTRAHHVLIEYPAILHSSASS